MSNKILCPIPKLIKNLEIKAKRESDNGNDVISPFSRCHCCKRMLDIKFFSSRGIVDWFKCRACYNKEFKQLLREEPLQLVLDHLDD